MLLCLTLWASPATAEEFPVQDAQVTYAGLRGSAFTVEGSGPTARSHGLTGASRSMGTVTQDWLTVHRDISAAFGYGTSGIEGEVGGVVRGGYRYALAPTHGPFVRGGVRGFVGGNDLWFHTHAEVPHAQLGYQLLSGETLFEVAFDGGLSVAGHYQAGAGGERPLTLVPGWGAELALHHRPVRLDVVWLRLQPRSFGPASGPLDRLDVTTCLTAWRLGFCQQFRFYEVDLASEEGMLFAGTQAFSGSLMLGLATSTSKHEVIRPGR